MINETSRTPEGIEATKRAKHLAESADDVSSRAIARVHDYTTQTRVF